MIKLLLLLSLFLPLSSFGADGTPPPITYEDFKILRVIDGDTIRIDFKPLRKYPPLNLVSIRILNIDTPEISKSKCEKEKKLGLQARQELVDLIKNSNSIEITNYSWDKYGGRILGIVKVDGISISDYLLEKNLAVAYHGKKKEYSWCN